MTSIPKEQLSTENLAIEGDKVSSLKALRPFQIVSLLEMLEHDANLFYIATRNLHELQTTIESRIKERGGMSTLTDREIGYTNGILDAIRRACLPIELDSVLHRLRRFNNLHFQPYRGQPFTLEQLRVEVDSLVEAIASALCQHKFMVIPDDKAKYYDKPELFSFEVAERFPKANKEIIEAGNCYATGNNTACVFHLMRAVELGARVLIRRLGITKNLPHPVELCDWGTIVRELEKAIGKLPKRSSVKASEKAAFYSHALAQFLAFKDAWRNQVSHTRVTYDEHQAMSVLSNTRQFMQHLASRLKE